MLEAHFQELGFNQKEVQIYLALAEAGKSTAHFLCKKTGIARATVYFVLDNLTERGLVSKEQKRSTTFYLASPPAALERMIEKERNTLERKAKVAHELSDALKPYFRSAHFSIPKLQFFEGRDNVENMLYDHIEKWRESLAKSDFTWWGYEDRKFADEFAGFFKWYWKRSYPREKTGEKVRIFSDTPWADAARKMFPDSLIRPVPKGYDFTTSIWILGDYIIVFMTRHKPYYAFQIHDPVFAANLKMVFKLLWDNEDTKAED